jgi:hypothetical protein
MLFDYKLGQKKVFLLFLLFFKYKNINIKIKEH